MAKLSLDQLMAKLADPATPQSELAEYFVLDEAASGPFAPQLRINPQTVRIPRGAEGEQRSAALLNMANWYARLRRARRFRDALAGGYDGPIIVSEGDSWFQYPLLLEDTIDHLYDLYAINSLGAAGDLLENMANKREYLRALRETGAEILLLSGGGNDLVAGGALASHLEEFDPDLLPEDYLLPSFHALLDDALMHYGRMFEQVQAEFPHVSILCHGYDYPVPNRDRWLGKPMERRGIRNRALQKAIAACMMDHFNRRLRRLARTMPNVTYIDCRGVVGDDRWHDGLHPTNAGYRDVAAKFNREIKRIANARSGPAMVISGPFGRASDLSRSLAAPAIIAGGQPKGMSLHLGLNTVDPGHYAGWDGRLKACEADALAMETLASDQGFTPTRLLSAEATREAVTEEIRRAARDLHGGDMFLFTVSAHGGRIPDFNRDEDHDGDLKMDETLCLYDFQLADDELYMLWCEFRAGVRVLMIPDTCHSGSMVRFGPAVPTTLFGRTTEMPGVRAMPLHVEDRVWRNNQGAYEQASLAYSQLNESVMVNPLTTPIKASVLNLGACHDDQSAMDGPVNGAFTGALLKVWDDGRFSGDYHTMRAAIDTEINSPSQTPQLYTALSKKPDFSSDRPFALQRGGMSQTCAMPFSPLNPDDEGEETDQISDAEVEALFNAQFQSRSAAPNWADYADFDQFIRGLNLRNFTTNEFLVLGGAHNSNGPCAGKNTYPPRHLWPNIAETARVLDHLRDRLGKPIAITNAYRAPGYNRCIGGAKASQHMKFTALDFKVRGMKAPDVAAALRMLRDRENLFVGGIGRYNSFTHVDTRGTNATWPKSFRDSPVARDAPMSAAITQHSPDRLTRLRDMPLADSRATRSEDVRSAFGPAVARDSSDFNPASDLATHQQNLSAAVSASSVISFVDTLTPGQKEDVLLSTLFAQRAADAQFDPIKQREDWFGSYMETLGILGWVRSEAPFSSSAKMQGSGSFDQLILATLAQVATGNQFDIVNSAMDALRGLADDDGKIKLFDFETSHTSGGNFQIGSAEAGPGEISLALGAFNYTHKDKKRNILFVSWGKNELDYWLIAQRLSLGAGAYDPVRDLVKSRLDQSRKSLIADIPL